MLVPDGTCSTCCRASWAPWRSWNRNTGAVEQGCIDAAHDSLAPETLDGAWHYRPDAVALRARIEADRARLLSPAPRAPVGGAS